jgi:hypothetical protein
MSAVIHSPYFPVVVFAAITGLSFGTMVHVYRRYRDQVALDTVAIGLSSALFVHGILNLADAAVALSKSG